MSGIVRVYEIAEEAGVSSAEVINKAKDLNIDLQSPQSAVSYEDAEEITNYIMIGKSNRLKKSNVSGNILKAKDLIKLLNIDFPELKKSSKELGINLTAKDRNISYENASKIIYSHIKKSIKYNSNLDKKTLSDKKIEYNFNYKNILFKGVPGTGKSRTINNIIKNKLNLSDEKNVLRINIHSATSNSDLMQGIGINTNKGNIEYKEKQGLILNLIEEAIFTPFQPFVLILEEIQENSLNELIGDLIYLIENSKRTKIKELENKEYSTIELIDILMERDTNINTIKLPNLVDTTSHDKTMIFPDNLFIFCTSNYRDDKKVIEDNLLRRFDVIEIYPKYKNELGESFKREEVSNFLEELNNSIINFFEESGEIHPDRFMIGHSIWMNIDEKKGFARSLLKVITEFKDIKDIHFDDFKEITKDLEFPFEIEKNHNNYIDWIKNLQSISYDFID